MDKKKFELKMENFFEKAGVTLLKKGEDYQGGEETAAYILLDSKRKSFYLAESDLADNGDLEISEITAFFSRNLEVSEIIAKTVLRMGRAGLFYREDFTVEGTDLTPLIRKSAFIVGEENAENMTEFLKKYGVTFQAVPYKGEFLVMFFDRSNSKKIVSLYKKVSEDFLKSSSGAAEAGSRAIQLIDEIDAAIQENKILFDIDRSDNFSVPSKEDFIREEPADGLEGKGEGLVSIEEKTQENVSEPIGGVSGNDKTVLKDVFEKEEREVFRKEPPFKKIDKNYQNTEKLELPLPAAVAAARKLAGGATEEEKKPILYKIALNAAGIVFFLPAYILNKITLKKVPPFIIYWVAAIVLFFGLYQLILSPLYGPVYENAMKYGAKTASFASGILGDGENMQSVDAAASDIFTGSVVVFIGWITAVYAAKTGVLLNYLLAFSSAVMIFPFARKSGARLCIFFILVYFTAPLMLISQTILIDSSVKSTLGALKPVMDSGDPQAILSAVASVSAFAVYILPVIILFFLYAASAFLNPYKGGDQNGEVIP